MNRESVIAPRWQGTAIRAVLFDLDGTLVDTAPDLGAAANVVRERAGLAPLPLAEYRSHASAGARGLIGKALGIGPEHPDYPAHRELFLTHYRAHIAERSRLFDGIDTLLRRIESGDRRWGVVTNKPSWLTRPLLDALDLSARCACSVSADEVAQAKPAPDSLLRACALLGLEPSACVYVGDDERDIVAGRAAGIPTIAAAWGYLGNGAAISDWGADAIVETPNTLTELLHA
ncbi:phosphoglycolate phosphatase [Fontimonas sp. SYSU GA230001]|uniref:phosphoglycolate phosphatase n=1 Tax=Fontimonas sp. SYSU GA230001 TaxID=3142450 RepID=UPI0032B43D64